MNPVTKITVLPALTADVLHSSGLLIDNIFATLWQQLGIETLLRTPLKIPKKKKRINLTGGQFHSIFEVFLSNN